MGEKNMRNWQRYITSQETNQCNLIKVMGIQRDYIGWWRSWKFRLDTGLFRDAMIKINQRESSSNENLGWCLLFSECLKITTKIIFFVVAIGFKPFERCKKNQTGQLPGNKKPEQDNTYLGNQLHRISCPVVCLLHLRQLSQWWLCLWHVKMHPRVLHIWVQGSKVFSWLQNAFGKRLPLALPTLQWPL